MEPSTKVASLTVPASRVWNMCMLAHVDHGKSALSDALVASNGIISARQAGHVRYLDSRADEQRRGITMKSSSIALGSRAAPDDPLRIVNLVDSPGHCDFSGEVEAALRVCDGAVLVVDVVEGVCVQTVTVLRAALEHAVRPVLVLNKVDRLFVELQLDPLEAYHHIQRVLEQVNVIMGVREVEDMMARADLHDRGARGESNACAARASGGESGNTWTVDPGDGVDAGVDDSVSGYFSPERGNVAFASAIDGWAFRVDEFAALISQKFGISERVLRKTLWGDFYLQTKPKRIVRKRRRAEVSSSAKPMFVQFVLANLHAVYDAVYSTRNDFELAMEKRKMIADKLGLTLSNRDLKHKEATVALRAIMGAWLPAGKALMALITERLPSAAEALGDRTRLAVMWPHLTLLAERSTPISASKREVWERQKSSISGSDSSQNAPVLAFVTKMLEPVDESSASGGRVNIRQPKPRSEFFGEARESSSDKTGARSGPQEENAGDDVSCGSGLVAFARVLSGTLSVGDRVYVYGARYSVRADGSFDNSTVGEATVSSLFLLMGRDMEHVSQVSAGSIVGIGGLGDVILKTATVSTLPPGQCLSLGSHVTRHSLGVANDAVVRVAVEPNLPGDTPALQSGLRKLNQADPAVETYVTAKGEHVIAASGELHLERCLLDLRERFAPGVQFHVSPPIVSFRETIQGMPSAQKIANLQEGFRLNSPMSREESSNELKAKDAQNANGSSTSGKDVKSTTGGDASGTGIEPRDAESSVDGARANGSIAEEDSDSTRADDPLVGWGVRLDDTIGNPSGALSKILSYPQVRRGRVVLVGNSGTLSFRVSAAPLPGHMATVLDEVGAYVRSSVSSGGDDLTDAEAAVEGLSGKLREAAKLDASESSLRTGEDGVFVDFWSERILKHALSAGPRQFGSNLLIGPSDVGASRQGIFRQFLSTTKPGDGLSEGTDALPSECFHAPGEASSGLERAQQEVERAIITGFQLAVQSGPLCEEPMHGVCVFVDEIRLAEHYLGKNAVPLPSTVAGLVIGATREAIRLAYLNANPRLMEAALRVQVAVRGDALGRTYTVLAKRRGRVLSEDMKDGVSVFSIDAVLPLTESFGFADALRKQTSGFATAQLVFSHWESIEADPFWMPRTEEELEDIGTQDSTESRNNIAKKLITSVRRRKGLSLEEKVIESAEKQRTLSRKK